MSQQQIQTRLLRCSNAAVIRRRQWRSSCRGRFFLRSRLITFQDPMKAPKVRDGGLTLGKGPFQGQIADGDVRRCTTHRRTSTPSALVRPSQARSVAGTIPSMKPPTSSSVYPTRSDSQMRSEGVGEYAAEPDLPPSRPSSSSESSDSEPKRAENRFPPRYVVAVGRRWSPWTSPRSPPRSPPWSPLISCMQPSKTKNPFNKSACQNTQFMLGY